MSHQKTFQRAGSDDLQYIRAFFHEGKAALYAVEAGAALEIPDAAKLLQTLPHVRQGLDFEIVRPDAFPPEQRERLPEGKQVVIVYESGLFALAYKAAAEKAHLFIRWAAHELFPVLREEKDAGLFDGLNRMQVNLIVEAGKGNPWAMAVLEARGIHPVDLGTLPAALVPSNGAAREMEVRHG